MAESASVPAKYGHSTSKINDKVDERASSLFGLRIS